MSKLNDLTKKRFGILQVIKRVENDKNGHTMWLCKCDCGNKKIYNSSDLIKKRVVSCGCNKIKNAKKLAAQVIKDGTLLKASRIGQFKGTKVGQLNKKISCNNTSGYKGVYFNNKVQKWQSEIFIQGKKIYLGRYKNIDDAIKARQEAEKKYFNPIIEEYKNLNLK